MPKQRVDIGNGPVEAILSGEGGVTVVFENGLATSLEEWDAVIGPIEARARTLRYNRRRAPDAGPVPVHSAENLADDLAKLLGALELTPPYILVGHSWGGAIARVFVHKHPSEVIALILVDASNEAMDSPGLSLLAPFYALLGAVSRVALIRTRLVSLFCPPAAPASYRARVERTIADPRQWSLTLRTARAEGAGIRISLAALRRCCPNLPPITTRVLIAGDPAGGGARVAQRVHATWEAMVARSATASLTRVSTSGHHMPLEVPGAVSNAIADVLDLPWNSNTSSI